MSEGYVRGKLHFHVRQSGSVGRTLVLLDCFVEVWQAVASALVTHTLLVRGIV